MKTIIVLFGITGDLSKRKLLPALEHTRSELPESFELIGITRRQVALEDILSSDSPLAKCTSIVTMDLDAEADYHKLWNDRLSDADVQVLIYLAVPPLSIPMIVENIGKAGYDKPNVKLLLEKPFGIDEHTAESLFREVSQSIDDSRSYLVDHYLSKRIAREIVPFRRASKGLSSIWNHENIDRIEVSALETLDIEGRAAFYEQTGALRDVLQGHLLQLLALTIAPLDSEAPLSVLRARALSALVPADPEYAVRGQYKGYRDEAGSPDSRMETYAEVTVYSDDPSWRGVPFILRTGKALDRKETAVRVYFRDTTRIADGCLYFDIQPDEKIMACFDGKGQLADEIQAEIDAFTIQEPWDGYENVFLDGLHSDRTFFVSQNEVLASWRIVGGVLAAWQLGVTPLVSYPKGASSESVHQSRR